jgi:Na+-driven multidrug efflux pump
MTIVAMATALIPFIGQNWGAGNYGRVREGWTFSVKAVAGWGIFCFVMLFIFASPIASVFAKDPLVEQYLSRYLQIIPLSYGLGLMAITAGSLFNAVNRPWTAALINFVRLFALLVPLAWLGGLILGYDGLLSGISAANILTGILTLFLAYRFLDTHNTNGK